MLILTEKKSVAKDFSVALGAVEKQGYFQKDDAIITYCYGHLFELCSPEVYDPKFKIWKVEDLPIIPNSFKYQKSGNEKVKLHTSFVLQLLKDHKNDKIIIATDADREGELIARIVLEKSGINDLSNCYRFWVSEALTKTVIEIGLQKIKPLSEYDLLAKQGYARQHADWLIGMNFSRFISTGNSETFSVGRVQTAILFEIAKRNNEVKNFISEKYNELEAVIQDDSGTQIKAYLLNPIQKDNKTAFDLDDDYIINAQKNCLNKKVSDSEVKTVLKTLKPEKLLNLNSLQKIAYKKFGYTPEKTLEIAQSLYDTYKCLSYPRTPSRVMGDENVKLFLEKFELLKQNYSKISDFSNKELISENNKHIFNSSELQAHHALIPLSFLPDDAKQEEKNIFNIVVENFFTVCMDDYKYNEKTILFNFDNYIFRSILKEEVQAGYTKCRNITAKSENSDEQEVSSFNEKNCKIISLNKLEKQTQPKKEYSIDTLLAFMEKPKGDTKEKLVGLGTAATRADIIKKLFKTGYVEEEKKKLFATKKGIWLLKQLAKDTELSKIANINQTTFWENELENNPESFEKHIKDYLTKSMNPKIKERYEESICQCPLCKEGNIISGKKNYYCSKYKEGCNFSIWKEISSSTITEEDILLLCQGKTTKTKKFKSKAGKSFQSKLKFSLENKKLEFVFEKCRNVTAK